MSICDHGYAGGCCDVCDAPKVEQRHRDAAADLADKLEFELAVGGNDLAAIRNGVWDDVASAFGSMVQAFVRFEADLQSELTAAKARIAELEQILSRTTE